MRGAVVLALAAALAAAGCEGRRKGDGPPPAGLTFPSTAQIEADRLQKDQAFRTSSGSPLPAELRASFKGLTYYPVSDEFRFRVKLHRYPGGLPFMLYETDGKPRPAKKVGYVEIDYRGQSHRLQVYHLDDQGDRQDLFLPFLDATSGRDTYGVGRYLDLAPGPDGWYVLDFNLAYHPFCAYGGSFVCPRTPEENRLPFEVRAGERGWATHGAPGGKTG